MATILQFPKQPPVREVKELPSVSGKILPMRKNSSDHSLSVVFALFFIAGFTIGYLVLGKAGG